MSDRFEHSGDEPRSASGRTAQWIKLASILLIILSVVALVRTLPMGRLLDIAVSSIDGLGSLGPLAFALAYFVATVLLLPAWPLSVAAGALFGLAGGTLVVVAGATLGMAGAFLIARYAAREMVARKLRRYPRFTAIDRAVGEGGWRIVALLRLSPAVPFNLQNYLYGVTAIRFWPCIIASAVAILPGTFMYVYLGFAGRASFSAAGGMAVERGPGQWILLVVGLAATIMVTVYITRLARRAVAQQASIDADVSPEIQAPEGASGSGNPWRGPALAAAAAALSVTLAVLAQLQPGWLVRWAGPPAVAMTEAYEEEQIQSGFDHTPFDKVLDRHVNRSGGVDYRGIKEDPELLLGYNRSLADAPFDAMGRDERLALLINAYNSFTLELIIERLDQGITSIMDIPSGKRWNDRRWNLGGRILSLDQIEHEEIRPKFIAPDIHWALVCAAVGCPPLRREAYGADRIEEQMREQARIVHTEGSRWFRYNRSEGVAHLTQLYNWYRGDFEQVAGGVLEYAARYAPALARDLEDGRRPRIEWLEYDWALNNQENFP